MKKYFPLFLLPLFWPLPSFADLCKGVLLSEIENCGMPHHAGEILTLLHAGRPNKKHEPKYFEQQNHRCPWPAKKITLINCHLIKTDSYPYYEMILNDTPDPQTKITFERLYDILAHEAGFSLNKAGNLARLYLHDPNHVCSRKVERYLSMRKNGSPFPPTSWTAPPCPLMPSIAAYP